MLEIILEGKDGWVEENRNGEKSNYRKPKEGNYLKKAETERGRIDPSRVSTELVENCITTILMHMHINPSDFK